MSQNLTFFAPCTKGAEALLQDELRALGAKHIRRVRAGAAFEGTLEDAYRVLLWSRLASRVLLRLAEVPAGTADELYEAVRDLPWDEHMRADGTLAVDAAGMNPALRNTQFTAVRVKDAVCDRFRDRFGRRPNVDPRQPDLRINVAVRGDKATVSIDLSGEPMHRRGYRAQGEQVEAPLKETLAAAVVAFSGWHAVAARGGAFVDPMCGSGTLAIEAALLAADAAPGFTRRSWGFTRWGGHDAELWGSLMDEAADRRAAGLAKMVPIHASDLDPRAVAITRACVMRAGLDGVVTVTQADITDVTLPDTASGLVCANPPWGERLSAPEGLPAIYQALSELTDTRSGYGLTLITPDPEVASLMGRVAGRTMELSSGPVTTTISVFPAVGQRVVPGTPTASPWTGGVEAEPFANRLRKMSKHYGTWARRTGVGCYRVYDADLPDFALAIDRYQGAGADEGRTWVHVAEYAAPATIEESVATARLEAAMKVVPEVLGVSPGDVYLKRRERKRGTEQYEKLARRGATGVVGEAGLLFEVNLSDYLDTGLFLDHRDTRAWIGEMSAGARFLNLFAYTGAATVHAAAAGARETVTIDLSATYLEWAGRNMALNGFTGPEHQRVRADVLEWLTAAAERGERYDVIFCDPPTFSTSKRMEGTLDVQRDHVGIVLGSAGLLAEGGTLVFSCNKRGFDLDREAIEQAGFVVRDVTGRTIPKDFERKPGVHSCWTIKLRSE